MPSVFPFVPTFLKQYFRLIVGGSLFNTNRVFDRHVAGARTYTEADVFDPTLFSTVNVFKTTLFVVSDVWRQNNILLSARFSKFTHHELSQKYWRGKGGLKINNHSINMSGWCRINQTLKDESICASHRLPGFQRISEMMHLLTLTLCEKYSSADFGYRYGKGRPQSGHFYM